VVKETSVRRELVGDGCTADRPGFAGLKDGRISAAGTLVSLVLNEHGSVPRTGK